MILPDGEEEHFIFHRLKLAFNVTLAHRLVGFPHAKPDGWANVQSMMDDGVIIKPHNLTQARLRHPIILATIVDDYKVAIDGMHRITKAFTEQVRWLPAYILTEQETARCAIHHRHKLPDRTRLNEVKEIVRQLGSPVMVRSR